MSLFASTPQSEHLATKCANIISKFIKVKDDLSLVDEEIKQESFAIDNSILNLQLQKKILETTLITNKRFIENFEKLLS
jgi:hypothetical protein